MTARPQGFALVTGASGGIGRAITEALAGQGMRVCASGRDPERLARAVRSIVAPSGAVFAHPCDLASEAGIDSLAERVNAEAEGLDVVVHAAGTVNLGTIEALGAGQLDEQYRVNLRAPWLLSRTLLPRLEHARGQVVFINSTAVLHPGSENAFYAGTKQALRSLSQSLRVQLNPRGIRVLSIFPGRTATAMQESVCRFEGRAWRPTDLVQPADVAAMVAFAIGMPRHVEVTEIFMRPAQAPARVEHCG